MSDKLHAIKINFPCLVNLPEGFEQVLDSLLGMVCQQYEKENPEQVCGYLAAVASHKEMSL